MERLDSYSEEELLQIEEGDFIDFTEEILKNIRMDNIIIKPPSEVIINFIPKEGE